MKISGTVSGRRCAFHDALADLGHLLEIYELDEGLGGFYRKVAEAALREHPTWRGRIFHDLGHVPQMEAPGRWLAEVADWFADTLD